MNSKLTEKMQKFGFHLTDTGGNCTAYASQDETILITKQSDPEVPESPSEPITVGFYKIVNNYPEFETSQDFCGLNEFLK